MKKRYSYNEVEEGGDLGTVSESSEEDVAPVYKLLKDLDLSDIASITAGYHKVTAAVPDATITTSLKFSDDTDTAHYLTGGDKATLRATPHNSQKK